MIETAHPSTRNEICHSWMFLIREQSILVNRFVRKKTRALLCRVTKKNKLWEIFFVSKVQFFSSYNSKIFFRKFHFQFFEQWQETKKLEMFCFEFTKNFFCHWSTHCNTTEACFSFLNKECDFMPFWLKLPTDTPFCLFFVCKCTKQQQTNQKP